ncbi:MAG: C25 family cysteine peptidase, partial [Candidatus Thermoplasmatota archaeon]|nr:C25 family cysteine peptidase [Candidatus Thermoplasmatota archaeon]
MKNHKILVVLLIGIFITSSTGGPLGAGNISNTNNANTDTTDTTIEIKNCHLNIGEPTLSSQDVNGNEFVTIKLDESETFMSHSGEPMLPIITRTFDFPIGTKINAVNVNINWQRLDLDKKVTPTPVMVPNSNEITPDPAYIEEKRIDENIYSSTELYPTEPYTIKYGSGLKDMEHVIFVNVKCFPQYSPANNYVNIPTDIDINIEYEAAETPQSFAEQYDLIIITHDIFKDEFQRLVDHKIRHGITTKMVTVGEIYENYLGTATNYTWEAIKMYLADHVMNWDTKYVLLVGGHKGQTYDWYVPDFRSNNFDINDDPYYPHYDVTFSSDLYYADVYYVDQYGHQKFDNWNSNKNSIYAEGPASLTGTDVMDFYPDVGLGRLPVRYTWEAKTVVDKIIDYENNAADSWFKRVAIAGGDSFPWERYPGQATPGIWEGEIEGDVFAEMFADKGFTSTKMYCSDQGDILVTGAADCYNEVSKGYGFYCADGHANAFSLGSYKPDTGIMPPPITEFYSGFNVIQYKNKDKLFFGLFDGCHNAQIETTAQKIINALFSENPDPEFILSRYEWLPSDSESFFVTMKGGGAIGLIGNTALGLGGIDYGITEFVGGWIQLRFAEGYVYANQENTGAFWTYGINGYIDNFDVNFDAGDRKTIEERILLGDPSVKMGGYHTGSLSESDDSEETEVNYGPVSASVPTWSVGDSWTYKVDNIDWDLTLTEDRGITLKLSTGDIKLEVTEVTSDSYITSITSDNIEVTLGGMFDYHEQNLKEG